MRGVAWAKARSSKSAVADFDASLMPKSGKPDFNAACSPGLGWVDALRPDRPAIKA
jgi:hypothetical protein